MSDTPRSLQVTAELKNLVTIRQFIEDHAAALGATPEVIPDIVQAVDESATNIIEHGYHGQPGPIEVVVQRVGPSIVIRLRDQAPVFDPTRLPPPDLTLPLHERPLGGMGVYITQRLMDAVRHQAIAGGGNELTLIKNVSP
jgi:anti-sigma regulatory factor (Ser/Thr protein kinase)